MRVRPLAAVVVALAMPLVGCPDRDDPVPASAGRGDELRSDGEVLEAARALNQSILETTLAARAKLTDDEVQLLADDLMAEHRAARERALVLAERLELERGSTPLSLELERDAEARMAALLEAREEVLERDWLEGQLALHDDALDVLDRELLPVATAPEVRELLQDMRRLMTAHAARVEDVLARRGRG